MSEKTLSDDFMTGDLLPEDIDDDFLLGGDNPGIGNIDTATGEEDDDPVLGDADEEGEGNEGAEGDSGEEGAGEGEGEGNEGAEGDGDDNEFYLRAKYWQEDGFLSPSVELKKDMTQLDLENLYKEQIKVNAYNQIKTDIGDTLKANGVDPNKVFQTESEDEYLQKQYSNIASWTYDTILAKADKIPVSDTIRTLANEYWISKTGNSLDEEELEVLVEKDLTAYTEEELFNTKYKPYFANQAKALSTKIKSDTEARIKAESDQALADAKLINELLDKSKYADDIKQKVKDALFKKNQTYDDGKGTRKVGISLFEKRRLEANNDIKSQFQMALGIVLGSDFVDVKESTQRAAAVDTLTKLAKVGTNRSKSPNTQNKKTKTNSQQELEELLLAD